MKSSPFCCIPYKQTLTEQSLSTQECKSSLGKTVLNDYFPWFIKGKQRRKEISKTADTLRTLKALPAVVTGETFENFTLGLRKTKEKNCKRKNNNHCSSASFTDLFFLWHRINICPVLLCIVGEPQLHWGPNFGPWMMQTLLYRIPI